MATAYESYIDYVKRTRNKNERLDYAEYANDELKRAESAYKSALAEARANALTSLSTYGKKAESLSGLGLSGGGYSEYLTDLASKSYTAAARNAEKNLGTVRLNTQKDYEDYLKSYTKAQEKLFASVVSDMSKGTLTSYDTLLEFASTAGLSHDYAKRAAKTARQAVINKLRNAVIEAINDEFYSERESYEYAIKLGLSEDIAKELAEYAKQMRALKLSSDYLNQIKNEVTKENNK